MNVRIPVRLKRTTTGLVFAVLATFSAAAVDAGKTPAVNDQPRDFELSDLGGESVKLSKLTADGPVVLVVLRGWPGYQCPLCTRQFAQYMAKADEFKDRYAQVVFIYPGPADNLKAHAAEFVRGKELPKQFHIVMDPDYTVVNDYGLRWDAAKETAHPSTFVIKDGVVKFAKVSQTHGDRAAIADVMKVIKG